MRPGSVPSPNSDSMPMTRLTLSGGASASVSVSVAGSRPVIRAARGRRARAAGAGLALGSGGRCGRVEGRTDPGEDLQGQGGGELAGAVVEGAGGDPAVGAGAAVAAGLGVGGDPQARPADRLPELEVAEAGESEREVVIDLPALDGGEVGDVAAPGPSPEGPYRPQLRHVVGDVGDRRTFSTVAKNC